MRTPFLIILFTIILYFPVLAQYEEDTKSKNTIINSLYEVISGDAEDQRDWDRFRNLFKDDAQLTPVIGSPNSIRDARYLSVEDFVESATKATQNQGFYEYEIARRTVEFGNICHVFSTYESRRSLDDEYPFDRGINSIQLLFDSERWWVINVFWQSESEENPIPKKYRKRIK